MPQGRLDHSLRQPSIGEIMGAGEEAAPACSDQHLSKSLLLSKINRRWLAAKMIMDYICPGRTSQLVAGLAEQVDHLPGLLEPARGAACHIVDHTKYADHRRWQDRHTPSLVVEADVSAGHWGAQDAAAVHEPAYGLAELPHDRGVLRRSEIEAVGDRQRLRPSSRNIAVRLRQCKLRACVRIQQREAPVAVSREGDAESQILVNAQHASVLGLGEYGVSANVTVVLTSDPGLVAEVGRADHTKHCLGELLAAGWSG